ncbi:hypothetical protein NQ318_020597 [Aromia moschata]|uniref:Serine protease HTRA2, mitochondrial n=1 Tax=Aromia moschata TaxID=1265417 RepID=A0AAV8Z398_9CUCU|nr:hypothetical protein NQ318_020597 [Aromia moschata]
MERRKQIIICILAIVVEISAGDLEDQGILFPGREPFFEKSSYKAKITDGSVEIIDGPIRLVNCDIYDIDVKVLADEDKYYPMVSPPPPSEFIKNCSVLFFAYARDNVGVEDVLYDIITLEAYVDYFYAITRTNIVIINASTYDPYKLVYNVNGTEYVILNYFYFKLFLLIIVTTGALILVLEIREIVMKYKRPQDPVEHKVRQIQLLGTAGIASILLATYVLIKRQNDLESKLTSPAETSNRKVRKVEETASLRALNIAEKNKREETIREKYNFINVVVNQCAPAVFYLEIRDPYKKDLETGEPIITSNGSGFLISEDGWAITNAHVVLSKPQSTITAIMRDGKSYKVHVEDADMNIDLALLKLETSEKLPSLQFGQAGDTAVGEWVVALGSPLSLSNSVTVGIVSELCEQARGGLGPKNYAMTYIQTDASITFGNSGGPLVNLDGDVIGINNLRLTSGISFAIPVEYVKKFLDRSKHRLKAGESMGGLGRTLFGLTTISITPDIIIELVKENKNIPRDVNQGLLVWKIIQGTPASECGIEVGDIITHINGVPVKEAAEMYLLSTSYDKIEVALIHRGVKKIVMLDTKNVN